MFSPANQTHFGLTINGLEHDFQVLAFTGEEAISRPYFFNVELVSQRSELPLERFFDKEAFLSFDTQGHGIHGRIYHIRKNARGRYSLALVPHLSYLRHRLNQRIYQGFSVPKIIALILEEHGILGEGYRFHLGSSYPERNYCTQYEETDLHFIQRLCEEEGIHFHFQHSAQGHVLVFGDAQTAFPEVGPLGPCVTGCDHAAYRQEGQSDQVGLVSGHVLQLADHSGQVRGEQWLLTQVSHEGKQMPVLREPLGDSDPVDLYQGYRNRFMLRPWQLLYRPPLTHTKPRISASQSAVVIALEDEDEQCGQQPGRVKVKFPWDRKGRFDDKSSCWLKRAADCTCAAGPLRTGMEVLITFVENDPDQPLISGCLCGS